MYHQIARNKRNSIIVTAAFLAVWLLAGAVSYTHLTLPTNREV